jgi:hypothetical protein
MIRTLKKSWETINETIAERPIRKREANHESKCQSQMSQGLSGFRPEQTHEVLMIRKDKTGKGQHGQKKERKTNKAPEKQLAGGEA